MIIYPINLDEGISQVAWYYLRKVPYVKQAVEKKIKNTTDEIEKELHKGLENKVFLQRIPKSSWVSVSKSS